MGADKNRRTIQILFDRNLTVFVLFCLLTVVFADSNRLLIGTQIRNKDFLKPGHYADMAAFMTGKARSAKILKPYLAYYEEYERHAASSPDVLNMLGYCYYHLNRYQDAADHYETGIRKYPAYFWPYYNLATLYIRAEKYTEAVVLLEAATVLNPEYTLQVTMKSKGIYVPIILQMRFQYLDVRDRLKEAYQQSYVMLVLTHYQNGNYEKMLQSANFARLANVGKEGLFLYYEGVASYYLRNYPQAVTLLQESLNKNPANKGAYHYLSLSFDALGMKAQSTDAKTKSQRSAGDDFLTFEDFQMDPGVF